MEKHKDKNRSDKKNKGKTKSKRAATEKYRAPPTPTVVADDMALINAVMTNTPFEFGIAYTQMNLPTSLYVSIAPIMEALANNTTVQELVVVPRMWEPKDLKEFVACLSSANKGIKKIKLLNNDFNPNFVEALTKILKTNLQIKTIEISGRPTPTRSVEGFERFCDGMDYYYFEELVLTNDSIGLASYNTLFESLKYNQSIKILKLNGNNVLLGGPIKTLCSTLIANPTITELSFNNSGLMLLTADGFKLFNDMLKANYLKKLTLLKTTLLTDDLAGVAEELKNNTSITDLTVKHSLVDWKLFGEIISSNKTITRLNIASNSIKSQDIQYFNFGSNVALKELLMERCWDLGDYKTLLPEIEGNNSLKRLAISVNDVNFDPIQLEQFISTNKSLTDLKLRGEYYPLKTKTLKAISNGLKVNNTLRKFDINLPTVKYEDFNYFVNVLHDNNTLRELHMTKLSQVHFKKKPYYAHSTNIDDLILDLLKTNKSLRYITGAEDYPYLEARLKENRDTQDKIIRDTCTLINMIVTKPHSFILPIELWLHIFKFVSHSFVHFDFERYLNSRVQ